MLRLNDLVLLLVIYSSLLVGVTMPDLCSIFQPFPMYMLMFLLFLSFLSIEIDNIWRSIRENGTIFLWLGSLKLIFLPLGVFFLFEKFYPPYALGALLLSGISTGVVAPFISTLVSANTVLVLVMVIITSPLIPFTIPALVKILLGKTVEIPLWGMMRMLCLVIFVPILSVQALRRTAPGVIRFMEKKRFPLSLVIFAIINMGVFSKYSGFFFQNPSTILEATVVAIILGSLYLTMGLFALWKHPVENRIASVISLGNMNNVLIIVFASEFFGPLEPTLAAMYMVPFFGLIMPLRVYRRLMDHAGVI